MPIYKWKCDECNEVVEDFRPMKEYKNPCTCTCGNVLTFEDRDYTIGKNVPCGDKERVSTALGVHVSQIASGEAERIHPGATFNENGDMIIKNRTEQKQRLRERGWVNRDSYC